MCIINELLLIIRLSAGDDATFLPITTLPTAVGLVRFQSYSIHNLISNYLRLIRN